MVYLAAARIRLSLASLAGTVALCVAIAVLVTVLDASRPFIETLVISCLIGLSFHTSAGLIIPLCAGRVPWLVTLLIALVLGLAAGLALSGWYASGDPAFFFRSVNSTLWLGFFFGVIGTTFFTSIAQLTEVRERLARSELEAIEKEKQIVETQLKLLQAQIEPHFLFNTLGNVVSLITSNPTAARQTVENLTTLLRSSLRRTRADATTLGEEIEIVRAYLEIQRIRMGDRLQYRIVGVDAHRDERLPPLLLQPLVENAVVHGVAPQEARGTVSIVVSSTSRELVIEISDSGSGHDTRMHDGRQGTGTGLGNVRARLRALYGDAASVTLDEHGGCGITAILRLPRAAARDQTA
jgi:sensor histidine kinase YesM